MLYFFNVHDGSDYPDDEGIDLPTLEAARMHAARFAGELLQSSPQTFWNGTPWAMDVKDKHGLTLFNLMFVGTDAAAISGGKAGEAPERLIERARRD